MVPTSSLRPVEGKTIADCKGFPHPAILVAKIPRLENTKGNNQSNKPSYANKTHTHTHQQQRHTCINITLTSTLTLTLTSTLTLHYIPFGYSAWPVCAHIHYTSYKNNAPNHQQKHKHKDSCTKGNKPTKPPSLTNLTNLPTLPTLPTHLTIPTIPTTRGTWRPPASLRWKCLAVRSVFRRASRAWRASKT